MILQEAWRELRANKRFVFLFITNIALGLSGLVTMEGFRTSIQNNILASQKNILSADLAITSRKPLPKDLAVPHQNNAETIELFTMIAGRDTSRLVGLKAATSNFPLAGEIELKNKGKAHFSSLPIGKVWIYPEISIQLKANIGDSLQIGDKNFIVDDIILADPAQGFRGMATSGKIFLRLEDLGATKLLRAESTATYSKFFSASSPYSDEEIRAIEKRIVDPSIQILNPERAGQESSRFVNYLADYLGLASLVALFLAALGSAFMFRTWIIRRTQNMAIQIILGMTFRRALKIPFLQILLLALASTPITLLFSSLELSLLSRLVANISPVALETKISLSTLIFALGIAPLISGLTALPFLMGLKSISTKSLVSGAVPDLKFNGLFLYFIPGLLFLFLLAVLLSHSYKNAFYFFSALCTSVLIFSLAGFFLLRNLERLTRANISWQLRHAFLHLSRKGASTVSAFTALAISVLLINLLPQIRASIEAELEKPNKLPSLFIFDIQSDQLYPLQQKLESQGMKMMNISPLVRARLISINAVPFERQNDDGNFQTREDEMESRFRNRGFNLSYSTGLNESESLVSGKPFTTNSDPQISVEKNFADRLHLKLGDIMLFDIQGVQVSGKIVNTRKVQWTSFRPNFFVVFNDGFLNSAPQTFLGSLATKSEQQKIEAQLIVSKFFPNISAVDVKTTIDKTMELIDKIRWSLLLMAGISLFAGLVVLLSIASLQVEYRRWDLNMMKVLGANAKNLRNLILLEFGTLTFLAALFGASLSLCFSWTIIHFIFNASFKLAVAPLLASIAAGTLISLTVAAFASRALWKSNPAEILN